MPRALVTGSGGFIGGHLVKRLLDEGYKVRGTDWKPYAEWHQLPLNNTNFAGKALVDLGNSFYECCELARGMDEIYNLAADMGGMGFISSHKYECMQSVLINTNMLNAALATGVKKYFFSSSACVYPGEKQNYEYSEEGWGKKDYAGWMLKESDAYPADPEDGYGWEKLFSERMCRHAYEDRGLEVRVARYHNVYGPHGTWEGGREKAPAALCRKVAEAVITGTKVIDIWGDGEQTRSFMYVDDCIEGTRKLMDSSYAEPLNIGSSELVSIIELLDAITLIAGLNEYHINHIEGPQGVRGRNSDNTLIKQVLRWEPSISLDEGLRKTYDWVYEQVAAAQS